MLMVSSCVMLLACVLAASVAVLMVRAASTTPPLHAMDDIFVDTNSSQSLLSMSGMDQLILTNEQIMKLTFVAGRVVRPDDWLRDRWGDAGVYAGVTRCAVVSNSMELMTHTGGKTTVNMDSQYDLVFRAGWNAKFSTGVSTSPAPCSIWCRWALVGRRTDVLMLAIHELRESYEVMSADVARYDTLIVTRVGSLSTLEQLYDFLRDNPRVSRVALMSERLVWYAFSSIRELGAPTKDYPSSTLYQSVMASSMCDGRTDVYGGFVAPLAYDYVPDDGIPGGDPVDTTPALASYPEYEWLLAQDYLHVMGHTQHRYLDNADPQNCPTTASDRWAVLPMNTGDVPWFPYATVAKRYDTCAVVGAAGYMIRQEYGAEIDASDMIIRGNHHVPTPELVRSIGARTTYFVHNKFVDTSVYEEYRRWHQTSEPLVVIPEGEISARTSAFTRWYDTYVMRGVDGNNAMYSVGFKMFSFAYDRCKRIRLYGFSAGLPTFFHHDFLSEVLIYQTLSDHPVAGTTEVSFRATDEISCKLRKWTVLLERSGAYMYPSRGIVV